MTEAMYHTFAGGLLSTFGLGESLSGDDPIAVDFLRLVLDRFF
jgi:hypothetical protein